MRLESYLYGRYTNQIDHTAHNNQNAGESHAARPELARTRPAPLRRLSPLVLVGKVAWTRARGLADFQTIPCLASLYFCSLQSDA